MLIQTASWAIVNAKTYGAKGDGIQDDSPYINAAIAKAISLGQDLFIPTGNYKCIQFSTGSKILRLDQSGIKKILIYGEAGTKITTPQSSGSILYIAYASTNIVIANIFFENTHAPTMNQTNAIQLCGTGLNSIQNLTIQNCRFEGFSTAIGAQGVKGLTIQNCTFGSPNGHDNAQINTQPAVFIWLNDNVNGQCYNVKILNNVANGFTGSDITKLLTKRPMDGFVFGIAYGILIKGNITNYLSEEHIGLQTHVTYPESKDSVLITGNQFYQSLPSGSMKNSALLTSNYGIRTDCNNVTITNNDFRDYTSGILVFPFQFTAISLHSFNISGNRFYSPNDKIYYVKEAIKFQADPEFPVSDIVISSNNFTIGNIQLKSDRSVISVYDCINVTIEKNNILGQVIDPNGYSLAGILTQNSESVLNINNQINFK